MNAYTTRGQARIQPRDVSAVMRAYPLVEASLAALEWQRGAQAEAEVTWLLKQNAVTPKASTSRVARLRQTVGAALVRTGERLAGVPRGGAVPESASAADTLGIAG
jgi:hypothetical protein